MKKLNNIDEIITHYHFLLKELEIYSNGSKYHAKKIIKK